MTSDAMNQARVETAEVVRTRRLEVVDRQGRLRATLGPMQRPLEEGRVEGLSFFDEHGSSLMDLVLTHDGGVLLSFAIDGNARIDLSAFDAPSGSQLPGALFMLSDAGGTPVVQWHVTSDGQLSVEGLAREQLPLD